MSDKKMAFTHMAITVDDMEKTIEFYQKYGQLEVLARRTDPDNVWMSDRLKPFLLALLKEPEVFPIKEPNHIGLIASSKEHIDELCEMAKAEGCLVHPPKDHPIPTGYAAILKDPNGHCVELSFGQEAGFDPKFMELPEIMLKSCAFRKEVKK